MKYLMVLFSVLCLLCGCTSTTSYFHYHSVPQLVNNTHYKVIPVYVDQSFTKEEVATINKVVDEWNKVLNGQMRVAIASGTFDHTNESQVKLITQIEKNTGEGFMLVGLNHDDKMIANFIKHENEKSKALAFCDQIGDDRINGMFVIRDRIGMRNLHQVLLHEFGHALGSDHMIAYSFMYPNYGASEPDCVDKLTAAQVAGYQGIYLSHMNYCAIPNFP